MSLSINLSHIVLGKVWWLCSTLLLKIISTFTPNFSCWLHNESQNQWLQCHPWLHVENSWNVVSKCWIWWHFLSLSRVAVGPLLLGWCHQEVVGSSSCIGQRCQSRGSLLPHLELGPGIHGQPSRTDARIWKGDTQTLTRIWTAWVQMCPESDYMDERQVKQRTKLTRRYWFWRAPVSAPLWDLQWKSCSEEHPPPCRNIHPEITQTISTTTKTKRHQYYQYNIFSVK